MESCTHHSLGHKHIDVRRWLGHHPVDERGFAAVTAKIARIKNRIPAVSTSSM